jgi:hypothetical protein
MTPADAAALLRTWPPPTELRAWLATSPSAAVLVAAGLDAQTDAALAAMLPTMISAVRSATIAGMTK